MNKTNLILLSKKIKIYNFLKLINNVFKAIIYFTALILSKIFYNYLIKRVPKEIDYKFNNSIIGSTNFYEQIIYNVLVRKLEKNSYKYETDTYKFWNSENALKWFNDNDNAKIQSSYAEQSFSIIENINKLIISKNIKNLLLVDISTGNGNFLNFITNKINTKVKSIGFDINEKIITKNIKKSDLKHIEFKHGKISDYGDYITSLSMKYTLCFISRKSLTNYNNKNFNDLMLFFSRIKSSIYFFVIETNNFNYNKNKETEYRGGAQFFGHNYPLIFKKYNWKIIWSKKKYINFFINDHWIYYILSKKAD